MEHLPKAQKELQEVCAGNSQMAFVYASCVLFPETFIHQHQLQGKNREEAEVAFMEVAVDAEEKKVLMIRKMILSPILSGYYSEFCEGVEQGDPG